MRRFFFCLFVFVCLLRWLYVVVDRNCFFAFLPPFFSHLASDLFTIVAPTLFSPLFFPSSSFFLHVWHKVFVVALGAFVFPTCACLIRLVELFLWFLTSYADRSFGLPEALLFFFVFFSLLSLLSCCV